MKLDENAAAFGLFQLTFANLSERLAAAVFFIRRINEPDIKFEEVFKLRLSELHKALKRELKQLEGRSLHGIELQELEQICAKIRELGDWRNARAHPRVQIDESGIAIYDARNLKRLLIDRDECVEKIQQAITLTAHLDINVSTLVRERESEKKIHEMLNEIFKAVEEEHT